MMVNHWKKIWTIKYLKGTLNNIANPSAISTSPDKNKVEEILIVDHLAAK